ncbi:MAG: hypothetical protein MJ224_02400 [archaeon]|nr:hypothetical protein [archaeon]
MKYRDIKIIEQEIKEIINLMAPLENYLIDNPNDFGVEGNLNSLRGRYEELLRELGYAKNNLGVISFDFHIYDNNKNIDITQLGHICLSLQGLINSCAMYEDNNPVKKGSSYNQNILDMVNVKVDAVAIGSLNLLVSPKDNQSTFYDDSYLKRSLKQIGRIIDCGDDKRKITSLMEEIGSQPIFKYKSLLNNLKNDNLNLDICYSVKPKGINTKSLTATDAEKIYNLITDVEKEETNTINVIGILYSVDVKNKKCGIEVKSGDLDENKTIRVSFRDSFKKQLKEKLDTEISVSLERTIRISAVEEDSKPVFNLLELN